MPIASEDHVWENRLENSTTSEAATKLSHLFSYNIPERWSMTGEKVLGAGDASGMFPIDPKTKKYDLTMISQFEHLIADYHFS